MQDEIYKYLKYPEDISVEDWNKLITLKFKPFFNEESVFLSQKETLRTELVSYLFLEKDEDYFKLFEWTFDVFKQCLDRHKEISISELAKNLNSVSATDMKWMSITLMQQDISKFSVVEKTTYIFKLIEDILEGVFKVRFGLLFNFTTCLEKGSFPKEANQTFGNLIHNFSNNDTDATLFLKDPIFGISTNQWRNISAHKSYEVKRKEIIVKYGRANKTVSVSLTHHQLGKIFDWSQNIYRVIRLAQTLVYLNNTNSIISILGSESISSNRFESTLFGIIHNLQIVGFEFISTEDSSDTFCINLRKKIGSDVKESIIHASQALDQISSAIYFDELINYKYTFTKIKLVEKNEVLASAKIRINHAIRKVNGEITMEEYINKMDFNIE